MVPVRTGHRTGQANKGRIMATDQTEAFTPEARSFRAASKAFSDGTDSPRVFLERCIEAIDASEAQIGAFVTTNLEAARAAADQAGERWRSGRPLSSVDGMPVGIKDIMETADMPTEQGSPLFTGWRGGRDSAAVAALREAGCVVVGKTVTTEFAATVARGTRNPWDPARTPGGSSSGSAAAVAAGMVSGALGTQVIGSTIRPASFCGCFGFKPSVGGINRGGSFDVFSQSCTGTLAATLGDGWNMARAISARAGGDPGYPGLSGPLELPPPEKPRRVAVLATAGWKSATADAKQAMGDVRDRLHAADIELIDRTTNESVAAAETAIAEAAPLSRRINAWETRWPLNTYARDMDRSGLSQIMQDRLAQAEEMTLEDYQAVLDDRRRVRETYAALKDHCDVCVTLAASGPAPLGLDSTGDSTFAVPSSLLGAPALSLPVLAAEGLPLGLQMIGFTDDDAAMFSAAGAILPLFDDDRSS
jgi:Asp-tRNA(Asn)/Glu-tRNA(Gln) amidotransferase A subunit family amidase